MDIIAQLEAEQIAALAKKIPDFKSGDTLRVGYKVTEGTRSRVQNYEGVTIFAHHAPCSRGVSLINSRGMALAEIASRPCDLGGFSPSLTLDLLGWVDDDPTRRQVNRWHHRMGERQ